MRNFHLPLPDAVYTRLRAESERLGEPATVVARMAIDEWLFAQHRKRIDEETRVYAEAMAGTGADLDPDLEAAGIEVLQRLPPEPQ